MTFTEQLTFTQIYKDITQTLVKDKSSLFILLQVTITDLEQLPRLMSQDDMKIGNTI